MSRRTFRWLRRAAAEGARVLVGDPGRAYLAPDLVPIATYLVRTTRELENAEVKDSTVFTFPVERD
jgi:predicted nicotinamide N-methyase